MQPPTPSPDDLELAAKDSTTPASEDPTHPDPLTGEPGAHPIGVGVGAVGAGVAGAVIGSLAGPIGTVIGAAIGAVAGGLAGKEVAASDDNTTATTVPTPSTDMGTDSILPVAGMSGMSAMPGMYDAGFPATAMVGATKEREVAGSNTDETTGIGAGQFHDAFTATTLRETEEENRLVGDDAPDPDLEPDPEAEADLMATTESLRTEQHQPGGEAIVGGTPLGRANERHEHICTAAYHRYLARQGVGDSGDALSDWLAAEREFPAE